MTAFKIYFLIIILFLIIACQSNKPKACTPIYSKWRMKYICAEDEINQEFDR